MSLESPTGAGTSCNGPSRGSARAIHSALARQGRTDLSRIIKASGSCARSRTASRARGAVAAHGLSVDVVQSIAGLNASDVRLDAPRGSRTREGGRQLRDRALKRSAKATSAARSAASLPERQEEAGSGKREGRRKPALFLFAPSRRFPGTSHFWPGERRRSQFAVCSFPPPASRFPLPAMIQLIDVYKAFGPKRVLEGFTLDVVEGETMVIIGYSGTGKSVAIKHIVGLLEPDSGQVIVDGLEVPTLSRRELYQLRARIGYVFQFAALFDSFSIGENVAMGLRKQQELSEREIADRVHEALDLVDLPNVAERFPAELSGGMRKRVGIARAIALRPKYILYDEPTTGLDPVTSAVIDQLMVRMRDRLGVTSIVITHDMRSAYTVGTRIAMLYQGRVRAVGSVDEIKHATDPIVRQFVDGRPTLEPEVAARGA